MVCAVTPFIPLAAHYRRIAGLRPQLWRLCQVQHGRLMLGMVFEQQEVFKAAMQRYLFRLDFHLVELCQVEWCFFYSAIPVGELLLKIVQGPAALRRELADVLHGYAQEAA